MMLIHRPQLLALLALLVSLSASLASSAKQASLDPSPAPNATEEASEPSAWIGGKDWWDWPTATGDWNGHRTRLEAQGFTISSSWTIDTSKVESGGVRRQATARSLFEISAEWDLEPLLAIPNTRVAAQFYAQSGRDGSVSAGDLQAYSNLDSPNRQQLAELWVEHSRPELGLSVKVGKFDANTEFAVNETGGGFLNSSMGFSPTIASFPSYPDPAVGVRVGAEIMPAWTVAFGVFDGALQEGIPTGKRGTGTTLDEPSDLSLCLESRLEWGDDATGRLTIGGWHHTGHFDRFGVGRESGTEGFYAIVEQVLAGHEEDGRYVRCLSAFGQYGYADATVSEIAQHWAAGLVWHAPIPTRDDDELGFAVTSIILSDRSAAGFTEDAETAFELYYRAQITPWLTVQPDLQYIRDPGGDASLNDAVVATLRFSIDL